MLADVEPIEDDRGLSVRAIEFDRDAFALVFGGQLKDATVPADAGFGVLAAKRIKALALQIGVILEGRLDRPVMGQIDATPVSVAEGGRTGRNEISGLLKVSRVRTAVAKVLGWIIGIPKMEGPSKVEQEAFAAGARCRRGQSCGRAQRAGNLPGGVHRRIDGTEGVCASGNRGG